MAAAAKKRKDPKRRRRAPHEVGRFGLLNTDPTKRYVWANVNDDSTGAAKYLADGYQAEVYTKDGVRPRIGMTGKMGQEIINSGMLLVSMPLEEYEDIFLHGEDGESGQELADRFANRMFERDGANVDRFRGVQNNSLNGIQVAQVREPV